MKKASGFRFRKGADGRWWVSWYDRQGNRHQTHTDIRRKSLAEAFVRRRERQIWGCETTADLKLH